MKSKEFFCNNILKNVPGIFILKLKFHFAVINKPAGIALFDYYSGITFTIIRLYPDNGGVPLSVTFRIK